MQDISELKNKINLKTFHFFLLALFSGGIYTFMWMYKNQTIINKVVAKEIVSNNFIILIATLYGFSLNFLGEANFFVSITVLIIGVINFFVLSAIWAFKNKSALQEYVLITYKVDLKMNVFYTFLFGSLYINYCINDLSEVKRKQDIIQNK